MQSPTDAKPDIIPLQNVSLSGVDLAILAREILGREAVLRFQARGNSMTPFIRDGDIVTLVPLSRPPRIGDVVAFAHPRTSGMAVHRA